MERKRKASQKQSTVVEEGEPKSLKLVLKVSKQAGLKKPTPASLLEDCVQLETADEVLDQLLQISESHLQMLAETCDNSVDILQRMWEKWRTDVPVCSLLVHHLAQLAVAARQLPMCVQEFALSLMEHDAEDVKVLALKCQQEIVQRFETEVDFAQKVLDLALKEINNIHHGVRVECLKLIGQLSHLSGDVAMPLAVLEEYCNDADPRVRTAAFQALFEMHKRGSKLPLSIYYKASDALLDSNEDARCVAVRLVWAIAFHYAENTIPLKQDSSVEMKLLDDAFIKICDMVNDSAVGVRALSAGLLGDFHAASSKFLDQTLDKKLMSHLKVVKSEHERQRELHQGGGGGSMDWDSGRQWGSSAPKIELDPGNISLMSAGACGAFVHGLEDEFMEVRTAAVDSMCQLSIKSRSFAAQSLDFLVDMFNDEIEAVRLKAINCLRQVSATIELREDQLETILGILEESSCEIREALHSLLSSCRITTRDGLNSTIHALLDNLKKYPNDSQSIWKCLQQLGRNHGYLVSTLVPELLSTHTFFMGKEPDVDDPAYICILILVFNAAVKCPTIPPLFPSHVFRHYTYLRDTLPSLIPWIRVGMPSVRKLTPATKSKGQSGVRAFLCQVLSRAQSAGNLQTCRDAQQIWRSCIADLRRVSELDSKLAAMARCAATFLQCQLLMDKVSEVLSQDILLSTEGPGQTSIPHIVGDIREGCENDLVRDIEVERKLKSLSKLREICVSIHLLLLSYRLEHTYSNLSPELGVKVQLIRVAAHAMLLLLAIQLDFDTEQSEHFLRMKQCFAGRLTHIQSFCETRSLSIPAVLSPLYDMDFVTIATESLSQYLQPLVTARFCTSVLVEELSDVCQCRAEILEPKKLSQDNFTKFVSSLALSVHVGAALYSITLGNKIAVQARFPDGRCLLFSPRSSEVRWVGEGEKKLDTDIVVSHGVWTDPCQVELCVVMRYPTDIAEDSCFPFCTALQKSLTGGKTESVGRGKNIYHGGHMHTASNPIHSNPEDSFDHERSVLAISDIVQVNLHPQLSSSKSFNVFS